MDPEIERSLLNNPDALRAFSRRRRTPLVDTEKIRAEAARRRLENMRADQAEREAKARASITNSTPSDPRTHQGQTEEDIAIAEEHFAAKRGEPAPGEVTKVADAVGEAPPADMPPAGNTEPPQGDQDPPVGDQGEPEGGEPSGDTGEDETPPQGEENAPEGAPDSKPDEGTNESPPAEPSEDDGKPATDPGA